MEAAHNATQGRKKMKLIEVATAKALNPSTLKPCRKYVYKFDTGNSANYYDGCGWTYHNRTGGMLNPIKGHGLKAIEAMKEAIKAGVAA